MRWLRPGGSLIAMVPHAYLPEIMQALSSGGLSYHWTLAYSMTGPDAKISQKRVYVSWKPLLWYVKDKYAGHPVNDVITCTEPPDKAFHKWQQSESGFSELIRRFARPDDVICDPMMGSGTTGLAATALGCKFIGIENDPNMPSQRNVWPETNDDFARNRRCRAYLHSQAA